MNKLKQWVDSLQRIQDELFRWDSKIPPHLRWKIGLAYASSLGAFGFSLFKIYTQSSKMKKSALRYRPNMIPIVASIATSFGFTAVLLYYAGHAERYLNSFSPVENQLDAKAPVAVSGITSQVIA